MVRRQKIENHREPKHKYSIGTKRNGIVTWRNCYAPARKNCVSVVLMILSLDMRTISVHSRYRRRSQGRSRASSARSAPGALRGSSQRTRREHSSRRTPTSPARNKNNAAMNKQCVARRCSPFGLTKQRAGAVTMSLDAMPDVRRLLSAQSFREKIARTRQSGTQEQGGSLLAGVVG